MRFETTVYSASHPDLVHQTTERPFWEIHTGQLDIYIGEMECVATHLPGSWFAVSVEEVSE